ncbi:hypothetical protein [Streptosporangium sp. NPDC002721]|uniref:hypothetical protein n=1 Tax=Streptosporangium sp. NPDC002721 TaxID=3366188 RepID=UPI0036B2F493
MTHTEDELRAALADDVVEGLPDVREIVRRGRRIRRRRAVVGTAGAAGAALAVAAAAAVAFPVQGFWRGAEPVEKEPPTAARISPSFALPPENSLGAPLIESYGSTTVPDGATVTFRPLSIHTSYRFVCADPEAMLVMRTASGGSWAGRCGGADVDTVYDWNTVTSDWLERPQSFKIWILPGDTPIHSLGAEPNSYDDCKVVRKEVGMCDGKYRMSELLRPGVVERVAAELERQQGRWEVGFYDRAGMTALPRPRPTPTRTVTVGPGGPAGTTARPEPTPTRTVTVRP